MLRKYKNSSQIIHFTKPIILFQKSRNFHVIFSETNYSSLLLNAIKTRSLRKTQQIHAHILVNSVLWNTHLANLTLESYLKCGMSELARQVFEKMPQRDSMSWAHIIAFYLQNKQPENAVQFFRLMIQQGYDPNRASLLSALNSFGNSSKSSQGKQLHSQVCKRISPLDVTVSNVLINFYSKCRELGDARKMFDEIIDKDLVSWTSMLSGYSQNGLSKEAVEFFAAMHSHDIGFSHYCFSVTGKACGEIQESIAGEQLHCLVIRTGFDSHVVVASALLDMYSKHGKIAFAHKIFDLIDEPNVVSWTSIITGYVQINEGEEALDLFKHQIRAMHTRY